MCPNPQTPEENLPVPASNPALLNVYIVEDNPTIRENLVGTLEELTGAQVLGMAETENDARRWFAEHPEGWRLAIVDLFLKQGSGLGVLQGCVDRQPGQKVIVLTNYATPDIRKRCLLLGADAVFDKSNEIDGLVDYCLALAPGGAEAFSAAAPNPARP